MVIVAIATGRQADQIRLDAATQQDVRSTMFSLIALYMSHRRQATVPAVSVARMAPVAVNDRDDAPTARAA
jgi:hypothetical protein